jgi:hypothetical protein
MYMFFLVFLASWWMIYLHNFVHFPSHDSIGLLWLCTVQELNNLETYTQTILSCVFHDRAFLNPMMTCQWFLCVFRGCLKSAKNLLTSSYVLGGCFTHFVRACCVFLRLCKSLTYGKALQCRRALPDFGAATLGRHLILVAPLSMGLTYHITHGLTNKKILNFRWALHPLLQSQSSGATGPWRY